MSGKILNGIIFSVGAAVGAVSTWILLKKRYEQIVKEEIESVKKAYSSLDYVEDVDFDAIDITTEDVAEYEHLTELYNNSENKTEKGETEDDIPDAEVIDPLEFGEDEEYEQITLMFYADGSLTTHDDDTLIEDPLDYVGIDFENHFGEYDEDVMYVKNNTFKTYFEIIKEEHRYSDPVSTVN